MESEKDLISLVANATREAQQDNLGNARLYLNKMVSRINIIEPSLRMGMVHVSLQEIWGCGHADFCEEALSAISGCLPDLERDFIKELYHFSLEYLEGGRDPYFMESLQLDLRMAVKHLVARFDGAAIGSPLTDDIIYTPGRFFPKI